MKNDKAKKVRFNILINTEQSDYREMNKDKLLVLSNDHEEAEGERMEFYTEGELTLSADGRYCLSYDESEITGMEGSVTSVNFNTSEPSLVTLLRTGAFRMAMVFERGQRHICTYMTPYMPIEMVVVTKKLENGLTEDGGELYCEYSIEANGMRCERASMRLSAKKIEQ